MTPPNPPNEFAPAYSSTSCLRRSISPLQSTFSQNLSMLPPCFHNQPLPTYILSILFMCLCHRTNKPSTLIRILAFLVLSTPYACLYHLYHIYFLCLIHVSPFLWLFFPPSTCLCCPISPAIDDYSESLYPSSPPVCTTFLFLYSHISISLTRLYQLSRCICLYNLSLSNLCSFSVLSPLSTA